LKVLFSSLEKEKEMENGGPDLYVGKLVLGVILLLVVGFVFVILAGITGNWLFVILLVAWIIGAVYFLGRGFSSDHGIC
jgi:hypothetical protein